MSASTAFRAAERDLSTGHGSVRRPQMFAGTGICLGEAMADSAARDRTCLSIDAGHAADPDAAGGMGSACEDRVKPVALTDRRRPDDALDEPERACARARRALVSSGAAAGTAGRARRARGPCAVRS